VGRVGVGSHALAGAGGDIKVERSGELLERETHRLVHEGDWRRWGARGGREALRRYGADWFALLALRRWGRITATELEAARVIK
jgi:hypothetical protein